MLVEVGEGQFLLVDLVAVQVNVQYQEMCVGTIQDLVEQVVNFAEQRWEMVQDHVMLLNNVNQG